VMSGLLLMSGLTTSLMLHLMRVYEGKQATATG
jgi:hypothetical protein